jgi:hypothetical protein
VTHAVPENSVPENVTRPRFKAIQWANGSPAIDVDPYEYAHVELVMNEVCRLCGVAQAEVGTILDVVMSETAVDGVQVMAHADNWTFSIAFLESAPLRDRVLAGLLSLPLESFDLPQT